MRANVLARKTHKWLALVVGLQAVIWTLSGLYMVSIHIDTIHGDHLIREQPKPSVAATVLADPIALAARHEAEGAKLAFVRGRPAYVLNAPRGETIVDARTGNPVPPPSEAEIRRIASATYTGDDPIASAQLINEIPGEIRGRKPPLWRVEFAHWNKPTFYFSPTTGELVTRRHELWRIFDFMWMLHIMDYETRDNVNNWLLIFFSGLTVLSVLTGGWMLLYAFPKKREKRARA